MLNQVKKPSELKVLHVIPSVAPSRGGPSKAVIEMVAALKYRGIDAEIATTNDDADTDLDVSLNRLVNYKSVPVRFFARVSTPINAIREFSFSPSFMSWMKANIEYYDVIHVHAVFSFVSTYTMWLARKRNIAFIVRPIGQLEAWSLNQSKSKKEWYLKLIEQANLESANAIHFTADSERIQALERFPRLKAHTIPLGVNHNKSISALATPKEWNLKPKTATICYLSRLHPKKGLELLLVALSQLNNIDFQLIIAGAGDSDYESFLKQQLIALGLTKKCTFIGFIDGEAKQHLLESSDIFALTSYSENFGVAVLEAMAAGAMPFVSKEVALSDIVQNNDLGTVCNLNVDDIRHKLGHDLNNIHHCRARAKKAQTYTQKHYQWNAISIKLEQLYLGCLSKNQAD